jgi:hypothetical protein
VGYSDSRRYYPLRGFHFWACASQICGFPAIRGGIIDLGGSFLGVCFVDSWVSASRRGISFEAVHFRPCSLEIRGLQRFAAVFSIESVHLRACASQICAFPAIRGGIIH